MLVAAKSISLAGLHKRSVYLKRGPSHCRPTASLVKIPAPVHKLPVHCPQAAESLVGLPDKGLTIPALRVLLGVVELLKPFPNRCQRRNIPLAASRELSVPGYDGLGNLAHIQTYSGVAIEFDKVIHAISAGKVQRRQRRYMLGVLPSAR